MTYHQELLQSCPPTVGEMFGSKRDGLEARIHQAERLTVLMQSRRPFCFLRMGDMELVYLLSQQNGRTESLEYGDGPLAGLRKGISGGKQNYRQRRDTEAVHKALP